MLKPTLIAVCVALCVCAAFAEDPPAPGPIALHRAEGSIKIDGDLSDPGWKKAAVVDKFYETNPGDNIPAKVRTVAYLTYDDKAFYIGVRCDDPHPNQIRAPYVDRDQVIGTDDNIAVFIDTRNDKRTALELRVNPRGIQGDGIYSDANGGTEDFSPDYFYDTAGKLDATGWSAEYRIPFSSLRYPDRDVQQWNILIWRNYPRDFRYGFHSAPLPRSSNCFICHAHPLTGLTGLPHAGHLVVAPYVTAQQNEVPEGALGTPLRREPFGKDAGVDVKWTPTANNAIDMTINPDFSQVESDVAQITVNQRFAVFFPEKRPFFLEGLDLFDMPLQVVYTRTITSPRWGLRSTGRIGATTYTILASQDRGGGLTIIPGPTSSFFAAEDFKTTDVIGRVRRDIGNSVVGALITDREIRDGGHNRVIGPDFQWRPTQSDSITGEFLYSNTENPLRRDLSSAWDGERSTSHAVHADWNRLKQKYDMGLIVNDIGNGFRADLGFIPQVGYREIAGAFGLRFFPENKFFRFVRPSVFVDQQKDTGGNVIYRRSSPGIGVTGAKNLFLGVVIHPSEQYRVGDQLLSENYIDFQFQFDPSRRFTRIALTGFAGERIDFANARVGRGATITLTPTIRPHDKLTLDGNYSHEWLDIAGTRLYSADVERLKATYSFSAKSLVRIIGQYVSTDRNVSLYTFPIGPHESSFLGSILYSYKLNWQTVLFVGYGDDRELNANNDLAKLDRTLFFKISYALQR